MRYRHMRWIGHVLFWLSVLAFYTLYFGRDEQNYTQSLLFVCLLLPITIATTYFLLYVLFPRYLLTKRYSFFFLYLCYTLIASVYLELGVTTLSFMFIAGYEMAAMNPATFDILNLMVGMYLVVCLAAAINLLDRWYTMQAAHARLERAKLEAELKLKEAELSLLKGQIHPHFLFNTLNNLYSLTLERSTQAPDVVLRLSDMLDYMLYRGNAPRVPLADEVNYLRNYLALERLRYDDRTRITFEVPAPVQGTYIAPMLLIPFVENGFKHGLSQTQEAACIDILLEADTHRLSFTVTNSTGPHTGDGLPTSTEGIGLANVRRRLDLLYPDAHTLDIEEGEGYFKVDLTLDLETTP